MSDRLVVTDAAGRSLVVREREEGRFVAGDLEGRELADLGGDLTPFLVGAHHRVRRRGTRAGR